jgi:hypothetical protein
MMESDGSYEVTAVQEKRRRRRRKTSKGRGRKACTNIVGCTKN